jgi:hypothetical protein
MHSVKYRPGGMLKKYHGNPDSSRLPDFYSARNKLASSNVIAGGLAEDLKVQVEIFSELC